MGKKVKSSKAKAKSKKRASAEPNKPSTKPSQRTRPKTTRARHPDKSELSKRYNKIVSLKLTGSRRGEILEYARVQWGLHEAQADNYIAKATALIDIEAAKAREENYSEQVAFRRMLRKRAMGDNDVRLALDVAKDEAKILDLYPAEKHKHEFENVSNDDLIKQAKELALAIAQAERGSDAARAEPDNAEQASVAQPGAPEPTPA